MHMMKILVKVVPDFTHIKWKLIHPRTSVNDFLQSTNGGT